MKKTLFGISNRVFHEISKSSNSLLNLSSAMTYPAFTRLFASSESVSEPTSLILSYTVFFSGVAILTIK